MSKPDETVLSPLWTVWKTKRTSTRSKPGNVSRFSQLQKCWQQAWTPPPFDWPLGLDTYLPSPHMQGNKKTNKAWLLTLSRRVKRRILQKKKEVMMLTEIQNHNRYKAELKTHQHQGDHVFLCQFQTWPQVMQGSMLHAQSVSASISVSMEYWSMNLLCHPKP